MLNCLVMLGNCSLEIHIFNSASQIESACRLNTESGYACYTQLIYILFYYPVRPLLINKNKPFGCKNKKITNQFESQFNFLSFNKKLSILFLQFFLANSSLRCQLMLKIIP